MKARLYVLEMAVKGQFTGNTIQNSPEGLHNTDKVQRMYLNLDLRQQIYEVLFDIIGDNILIWNDILAQVCISDILDKNRNME